MRFNRQTHTCTQFDRLTVVPLLTVILLLLFFIILAFLFAQPQKINIALPKAMTSDALQSASLVVSVTNEDIIYFNNRVVTLRELRRLLGQVALSKQPLLIKADRRAAMGRIIDVWDLCRETGIERINLAATKDMEPPQPEGRDFKKRWIKK